MKSNGVRVFYCIGMLLPFCFTLLAQEIGKTSSIVLTVKDQAGGIVPNAHVRVLPLPNNNAKDLTTDSDGKLSLGVSAGSYDVTAESPGFVSVTKRIEAKTSTHQTIDIVLKVGSCPPGPCVMVTNVFLVVSFPAQSHAISPDGRYDIVDVENATEPHHSVLLEDLYRRTRRKVFDYDRNIALLWKPDSKYFAVTDYIGSDNSRCSILSVDETVPPIQVLDALSRQVSGETRKQLETHLSNHHSYFEAVVWDGPMSLQVKISGYGDADPEGFKEFYEVLLPARQPNLLN